MTWNKTDLTFKKSISKRMTDAEPAKYFYNEKSDYVIDIHSIEIKRDAIPGTPPVSTTSVVSVYTSGAASRLTLIEDYSVAGKMAWFASSNSTTATSQTDEGARLKDWISDKYGVGYEIKLYDSSDVQISKADSSEWYFDYQTGILVFKNANTDDGSVISRAPFKIDGYRYIGTKGAGVSSAEGDVRYLKLACDNDPLTGQLDLATQSTTIAPLKFTSGSLLSSPVAGVMEFDGSKVYITTDSGPTRKALAFEASVVDGTGTAGTITKWQDSNTLTDSIMSESGTTVLVAGVIRTTVGKSFYIPHPTKLGYNLEYGCLEGPEYGAYHRGRERGRGKVRVTLPEYWNKLVGGDYDIYLTSYCSGGMYVSEQDETGFTVSRLGIWPFRIKLIDFSYLAIGNRIDAPLAVETM